MTPADPEFVPVLWIFDNPEWVPITLATITAIAIIYYLIFSDHTDV